jgi:hypothetical protein
LRYATGQHTHCHELHRCDDINGTLAAGRNEQGNDQGDIEQRWREGGDSEAGQGIEHSREQRHQADEQ